MNVLVVANTAAFETGMTVVSAGAGKAKQAVSSISSNAISMVGTLAKIAAGTIVSFGAAAIGAGYALHQMASSGSESISSLAKMSR